MRILFISTENPFPVDHGHHIRTYHILRAMARRHQIHFVGFAQDHSGFDFQPQLEQLCKSVAIFPLRFRGWRQIFLAMRNLFSADPFVAQKYCDRAAIDYIRQLVARGAIEAVHIDMLHIAGYREAVAALPTVLVNHNVESLRLARWAAVERNPLLRLYLKVQRAKLAQFERTVCPQFDVCMVVSQDDEAILTEMCGAGNFEVIPNGVDGDYFRPNGKTASPNTLVWTGSMSSPYNRDGVDYFLSEIWPLVVRQAPDAKAIFVGKNPTRLLKSVANADSRISYSGYVEDVRPYIAAAAIFIAPLRAGSGTKIKVLNAMAQGKPVVTTPVGVEGIAATNGDEIIVANDPHAFANNIVFLLENPGEARRIGMNARQVIETKYDWRIIEKDIDRLYEKLCPLNASL
jgi:sugar transferase (PEP-CTERM/EpsH1 system associated)